MVLDDNNEFWSIWKFVRISAQMLKGLLNLQCNDLSFDHFSE